VVDVHYVGEGARSACVVARGWADAEGCEERTAAVASVRPYRPGAFFERELPCIVEVLNLVRTPFRAVVVDGYVDLDDAGSPGLGGHLHARLGGGIVVVGVAKTAYKGATHGVPVVRPGSARPLYVTARGLAVAEAARLVQGMHGEHRIPTLLKRVDQLARGIVEPRAG
jgi:deoxyribonuclease V